MKRAELPPNPVAKRFEGTDPGAELERLADAYWDRNPNLTREQAYVHILTKTREGQYLGQQAFQKQMIKAVGGTVAAPTRSTKSLTGGEQVITALTKKLEVIDTDALADTVMKAWASAGLDNTQPGPQSDQDGEGSEEDALVHSYMSLYGVPEAQARAAVMRLDTGIAARRRDRDRRLSRATGSIAISPTRSDTSKLDQSHGRSYAAMMARARKAHEVDPRRSVEQHFNRMLTDPANRELAAAMGAEQRLRQQLGA